MIKINIQVRMNGKERGEEERERLLLPENKTCWEVKFIEKQKRSVHTSTSQLVCEHKHKHPSVSVCIHKNTIV